MRSPVVLPEGTGTRLWRQRYVSTSHKFALSGTFAVLWLGLSIWISIPWIRSAAAVVTIVPAIIIVSGIAFVPGVVVAFLTASLLLDRQPGFKELSPQRPVEVLIAARNEERGIAPVLEYLSRQDYAGPIRVTLADNGSTDRTVIRAQRAARRHGVRLRVISEPEAGKHRALNTGLARCKAELVVTVDADTVLHPSAIRLLVARLVSSPSDVVAVAGTVLVRNSRASLWTRLQEWDYFLGIASVKRMQGLYQSTLVAQGAFSLYRTEAVRRVGGWPDAIGEDIMLTWHLLQREGRVFFEPLSVAFTDAPTTVKGFIRQRSRWARGMIEGLRTIPPWRHSRRTTAVLTLTNLALPLVDTAYTFVWMPGLVMAVFFHRYFVVGPMTLAVMPLTAVVYGILYRHQRTRVFEPLGLKVRRNRIAMVLFLLLYQPIMSAVSVTGYVQEVLRLRRKWR